MSDTIFVCANSSFDVRRKSHELFAVKGESVFGRNPTRVGIVHD